MKTRPDKVTRQFLLVAGYLVEAGDREVHGYAISEATGLHRPTVYKMLERMAAMGWLTQRWDTPSAGATRRLYLMGEQAKSAAVTLLREHAAKTDEAPARGQVVLPEVDVAERVAGLRKALDAVELATGEFGPQWESARKVLAVVLAELDPPGPPQ